MGPAFFGPPCISSRTGNTAILVTHGNMGSIVVGSVVAVPTNVQYTMLIGENSTKFQKLNDENFRTIVGLLKYLYHCSD